MATPEQFINWVTNQPIPLSAATGSTFGVAGTNHSIGLVPDPGSTTHSPAWVLGDDGVFHSPASFTNTSLSFLIDGGGAAPSTGIKGYILIPFACTITSNTLLADQSGSIVVDIFKCTFTQFDAGVTHPVAADKITGSTPPTISAATKEQDSTLTGWTTTINANDVLAFNVNSAVTITRVTLTLALTKN
jgi:hypothetical protein